MSWPVSRNASIGLHCRDAGRGGSEGGNPARGRGRWSLHRGSQSMRRWSGYFARTVQTNKTLSWKHVINSKNEDTGEAWDIFSLTEIKPQVNAEVDSESRCEHRCESVP